MFQAEVFLEEIRETYSTLVTWNTNQNQRGENGRASLPREKIKLAKPFCFWVSSDSQKHLDSA